LYIKGRMVEGRFVARPSRFLGIASVGGGRVKTFIPNPGRMGELLFPGSRVVLREVGGPRRKTHYEVIGVRLGQADVLIDSRVPNLLLEELLRERRLPIGLRYDRVIREPLLGRSRLDFELRNGERAILEAKAVTLVEDGVALFPDAPTARGARHMRELGRLAGRGLRAIAFFAIQRGDAIAFSPNEGRDPLFARALRRAAGAGVEVHAFTCRWARREVGLGAAVEVRL